MIHIAEKTFGRLDVLFNNAGVMHSEDDDAVNTSEEGPSSTRLRLLRYWEQRLHKSLIRLAKEGCLP